MSEHESGARLVAEVSSNHHRDLGRCLSFVERAAAWEAEHPSWATTVEV